MATFRSYEEYFQAVGELAARLEAGPHREAAAALRDGFACLNGLTDGWAMFLEAVEGIQARHRLDPDDARALETIRATAHAAVHRR